MEEKEKEKELTPEEAEKISGGSRPQQIPYYCDCGVINYIDIGTRRFDCYNCGKTITLNG